ncbi:MAG: class I SAM-dependent methyltransferase [Gemmataceae bacterium]|nr:class I SAM-dependent methyltransferase [Gemmataceae bacterium]
MSLPDWQLPPGVDRGLWDYLHAADMVAGYDAQMAASPLAAADVAICEKWFPTPGRLLDLGCGTGRLCLHFAAKGYECVGVDLSDVMLARAKDNLHTPGGPSAARYAVRYVTANLTDSDLLAGETFDYVACLFSTLGMVRGAGNRAKAAANAYRLLRPGGRFVLHAHNRFFRGLGWAEVGRQFWGWVRCRSDAGDVTRRQAYGGAPLTLHHFTRWELSRLLQSAGFRVLARQGWPPQVRDSSARTPPPRLFDRYGYFVVGERPR